MSNVDGSQWETKMNKLKDIIIENTNLRTDENLFQLSRGIAIVYIMPVLNSLIGIPPNRVYEEFITVFCSVSSTRIWKSRANCKFLQKMFFKTRRTRRSRVIKDTNSKFEAKSCR